MDKPPEKIGQRRFEQDFLAGYSDRELIKELQRVAELEPAGVLTQSRFRQHSRVSSGTISHRFGGWQRALTAAGLAERGFRRIRKKDEAVYIAQLIKASQDLGTRTPSMPEFDLWSGELPSRPSRLIAKAFEGWNKALAEAGLSPKPSHIQLERRYVAILKSAAQALHAKSPSRPKFDAWSQGPPSRSIVSFFGSWSKALKKAGLVPSSWSRPKEAYSKEDCLLNLANLWKLLGRQPRYKELNRSPSRIGAKAYERLWGTYTAALGEFESWSNSSRQSRQGAIGLSRRTRTANMSDKELLQELRRVADVVGHRDLSQEDVAEISRIAPKTFIRRLGSWKKALDRAGLVLSKYGNRYVEEDYFLNLMRVWEELGRRPKYGEMRKPPSSIPPGSYYSRFGSWRKALLAFLCWAESPSAVSSQKVSGGRKPAATEAQIQEPDGGSDALAPGGRDKRRQPTVQEKFLTFRRDGFKCVYCGRSRQDGIILHCDHKKAWSKGGKTRIDNFQTLCGSCNRGKGNLDDAEPQPKSGDAEA